MNRLHTPGGAEPISKVSEDDQKVARELLDKCASVYRRYDGELYVVVNEAETSAAIAQDRASVRDAARPAGEQEIERLRDENKSLKMIVDVGTSDDPGAAVIKLRKFEDNARLAERDRIRGTVDKMECVGSAEYFYKNDVLAVIDGQPEGGQD